MAYAITASSLILFDNWPGVAHTMQTPPKDGFDGTEHTDVTTAKYTLGEKVCVYDSTSEGWVTLIYLKNTGAGSTAVGTICGPDGTYLYRVDTDPDSGADITVTAGFCAIAVAVLAQNDYGWFWCGGPPLQDAKYGCSGLAAASIATSDGGVADGELLMMADATDSLYLDTWDESRRPVGITLMDDA